MSPKTFNGNAGKLFLCGVAALAASSLCAVAPVVAATIFNANAAFVANEVSDGSATNPFGPFSVGHSPTLGGSNAFTAGQHTDNFIGANPTVEGCRSQVAAAVRRFDRPANRDPLS